MKRIIIFYSGFESRGGGVVTHSKTLKNELEKRGFEVAFWSLDNHKYLGIIVAFIEKLLNKILPPLGVLVRCYLTKIVFGNKIKKIIKDFDAVIFENSYFFPLFKSANIIYFNHGFRSDYLKDFKKPNGLIANLLERYEISTIKEIEGQNVFISEELKEYAVKRFGVGEKSTVVSNFIYVNKFKDNIHIPWEERNLISFIGYLGKVKNPEFILQIALELKRQNIDKFKIIIAGQGPLENKILKCIKENELDDLIDFKGFISNEKVLDILKETKFLLLPSDYENFPFTLIEGRLSGCYNIINDELFLIADEFYDCKLQLDANLWVEQILKATTPDENKKRIVFEKYNIDKQIEKLLFKLGLQEAQSCKKS